jgi:putative membrane protein
MADRPATPSDYLAAERTFLAWIRTGLALMGFGFVVARFGLFLQALQAGQSSFRARPYGPSFWFGTGLIVVGVAVNLISARNHVHLVRQLNRGESGYTRPSSLAVAIAVILAALGLAMAIYLISVRDPKLLIFGNPKAGTPLMLAVSSVAIDLPLKALIWENADGKVWISYNTPSYL